MESGSYSRVGGLHPHEGGLNNSGQGDLTLNYKCMVTIILLHCHNIIFLLFIVVVYQITVNTKLSLLPHLKLYAHNMHTILFE